MPQKTQPKRKVRPGQRQRQPGIESRMRPRPRHTDSGMRGCDRLKDKVALITGGDSGIGRSVASDDSSYMTGQVLHPNGGEIVNT